MAFRKIHPAILAAAIAFLWSFSPGFAEERSFDASTLLRAGDYKKLDSYFAARQREFDAGTISGDQLRDAFRAFYPTDPDLALRFDGWVNAFPNSYVARLARGIYYKKVGLEERGGRYLSETSQDQLDRMDSAMSLAAQDFGVSIQMERKPFLSYFHTMDIGRQYISNEQLRKVFDKAAQLDPDSFGLRVKFMSALEPKWGGSTLAMRYFLADSRRTKLSAANLGELEAMVYEAEGDEFHAAGNLMDAEGAYRKALALGPCSCGDIRNDLNNVLFETGQFAAALKLLDEYLAKAPHDVWALANRGAAKLDVGRPQDAIVDWREAAEAGDSFSQEHLGLLYLAGIGGVQPNYSMSVFWLRKAAAQGELQAKTVLPRAEAMATQSSGGF